MEAPKTQLLFLLGAVVAIQAACQDDARAPYGDSGIGGGGGGGDIDGDTDTDSDTDSDAGSDTDECTEEEVFVDATSSCWLRCAVGQEWSSVGCVGAAELGDQAWALSACQFIASYYHTATMYEIAHLLGNCEAVVTYDLLPGYCDQCSTSDACWSAFPYDTEFYWTSTNTSTSGLGPNWTADFFSGFLTPSLTELDLRSARCVR